MQPRGLRARVVVGADGRNSFVAREVSARDYAVYPAPRMAAWAYFAGAVEAVEGYLKGSPVRVLRPD